MKTNLVLSGLLSAVALQAGAATTDWAVHGNVEIAPVVLSTGAFKDTYTFSLPSFSDMSSATVANNLMGALHISNGRVQLFREAGTNDQWLAAYAFGGTTGDITLGFSGLTAGNYFYEVDGTADGTYGGTYTLASSINAVPEPETYAMFLAGVGAIGMLYRRRRSD